VQGSYKDEIEYVSGRNNDGKKLDLEIDIQSRQGMLEWDQNQSDFLPNRRNIDVRVVVKPNDLFLAE
jgi:hypothetical protein